MKMEWIGHQLLHRPSVCSSTKPTIGLDVFPKNRPGIHSPPQRPAKTTILRSN